MFTGSSSWRSSVGALAALALVLALAAGPAAAAESAEFELTAAGDELFPDEGAAQAAPVPEPGSCLVIFRFSRLKAADPDQIVLHGPDGRALPLSIEPLFVEFGKIVDARMAFTLPAAEATDGRGPFTLKWGPEAAGRNAKLARISADPARRESYRTLRPKSGTLSGDTSVAKLGVIADSTAEYHFLWYLLPMSLVFALLLMRKWSGRGETGSARP